MNESLPLPFAALSAVPRRNRRAFFPVVSYNSSRRPARRAARRNPTTLRAVLSLLRTYRETSLFD